MASEIGGNRWPCNLHEVLGFSLGKPLTVSWPGGSQLYTSGQHGLSIEKGLNALKLHVSGGGSLKGEDKLSCVPAFTNSLILIKYLKLDKSQSD